MGLYKAYKYADAFDVAKELRASQRRDGVKYRNGVERVVALALVAAGKDEDKQVEAIVRAFESYRVSINPKWNGSIA